jgi:small conductance mechanosensitive channel
MSRLSARLVSIVNVLKQPTPSVEILGFGPTGTMLGVRSYCKNEHYPQVHADAGRMISEVIGDAGYGIRPGGELARASHWTDRAH